jgi:small-conductance mechanosensitive channel
MSPHIENLFLNLAENLGHPALLIELAVLAGLALAAWAAMRALQRHSAALETEKPLLEPAEWPRLVAPGLLLLLLPVARAVLGAWQSVHLLNLVLPLVGAYVAVHAGLHLLQRVYKPGRTLKRLQRLVSWLVLAVLMLHLTGYLDTVIAALDSLGFTLGRQHVSLYTATVGLLTLGLFVTVALWLSKELDTRLVSIMPDNANLRLALAKMARGLLLLVAILIALPLVGIDITVLSVFGGALGVGLGLGLQKIAANYVSGYTLLLDQAIRIGDIVTVGEHSGEITEIATRYTVIRSLDGCEAIVPNDTLITQAVVNHTLANRDNRILLPIQVAYDSDLKVARQIMLDVLAQVGGSLTEPPPRVDLTRFADSGIDLTLVFWIDHPEAGELKLRSDLNWAIWEGFQAAGIEIPYPQRVVHLAKVTPAAE